MQLNTRQYNFLERAITEHRRIVIYRRGNEFTIIPERMVVRVGREAIEAIQPSTGDRMTVYLDEIEHFEIVA